MKRFIAWLHKLTVQRFNAWSDRFMDQYNRDYNEWRQRQQ